MTTNQFTRFYEVNTISEYKEQPLGTLVYAKDSQVFRLVTSSGLQLLTSQSIDTTDILNQISTLRSQFNTGLTVTGIQIGKINEIITAWNKLITELPECCGDITATELEELPTDINV